MNFGPIASGVIISGITAALGGLCAEMVMVARIAKATQKAVKALMRADLVERYRTYRDCGGWMSDAHKDEWLHDYAIYHALVGKNGYVDAIRDCVVSMPTERPADAGEQPARCVGKPPPDEPRMDG